MKKYTKIVTVLMLIAVVLMAFSTVFADVNVPSAGRVEGGGDVALQRIVSAIITIFQIFAFAAAVIMLMFLGIKYVTASPDGKAEIKKSAVQYIVGAVILFAATGVLALIKNFAVGNIHA